MTPKSRCAVTLAVAVGLVVVLPAGGAAAKPKAKSKTQVVEQQFLLPSELSGDTDQADDAAVCPSGTTLLGGGALSNTPAPVPDPELDTELFRSGPVGNAWFVRYDNDTDTNLQPSVQAICLRNKLKVTGTDGKPKAVTRVTQVNTQFALPLDEPPTNGVAQADVACPEGTTILAGGGASFSSADVDVRLQESGPQGNGWHVRYDNDSLAAVTATASAMCLKRKLKIQKGDLGNDKARSKVVQVDQEATLPGDATNNGRARFSVACPEGTRIVGGGARLGGAIPPADNPVQIEESGAVGDAWQVTLDNGEAVAQSATVHALCLKRKLKVK
jgi:hypothetical protein